MSTVNKSSDRMTTILSIMLKTSAVLWAIWGIFHLFIGTTILVVFSGNGLGEILKAIPENLDLTMMGTKISFPVLSTLKQHAFNLVWIGVTVTIGSLYVWKRNSNAIFLCTLVGGMADLGYFIFVYVAGDAIPPGPQITLINALAILLSFYVYFRSDRLRALQ